MHRQYMVAVFMAVTAFTLCAVPTPASSPGYRIYRQDVTRGSEAPTDRRLSEQWVVVNPRTGGLCAITGNTCANDADCADSDRTDQCIVPLGVPTNLIVDCLGDEDVYLATSYVFDSGMETPVVSSNSEVVRCFECTGTDDDGDGFCVEENGDPTPDCDDKRAEVHVNAPQVCDGLNNDCRHPEWPELADTNESDRDGDGYSECNGDRDDTRIDAYPKAGELCDGIRNDTSHPRWPAPPQDEIDHDGDGFSPCEGDCADTLGSVFPGAAERCDGLNNDCRDPHWPNTRVNDRDADGDGFSPCGGDCDDTNERVHPLAQDYCNGIDDDCDGDIDFSPAMTDSDGDRIGDSCDNCPTVANATQADANQNGVGDVCERTPRRRPRPSDARTEGGKRRDK